MWWKKRIYLDSAAGLCGNPSSPHQEGRVAKNVLEDARLEIARLLEVQADDVLFTSGATESNALAILGTVRARRALAGPDAPGRNNMHVLYLPSAHASLVENVKLLEAEGVVVEPLPLRDYQVDVSALAKLIRHETVLVAMEAVCGETGVIWNTREVAEVVRKSRAASGGARIVLHIDASQAPLTEKLTRDHFGADTISLDSSKVSAVRGVGVLVAHRTIPLAPLYAGGGQERGVRSGSVPPDAAAEFAAALRAAALARSAFGTRSLAARTHLCTELQKIPNLFIQEARVARQVPNIVNISLPGRDTDYLVALLDEAGFAISTRSACETDSTAGSRAVYALTSDRERARATLRVSWGNEVTLRQLQRFARTLARAVAFVDRGIEG